VVVSALQTTFTVLIALVVLRTIQALLLRRNGNSALGQGLTYIIGTV
jgi:hypothetical protein